MLNIIDKFIYWDFYLEDTDDSKEYYEKVFDCAFERKGLIITYNLLDKDIKNNHKKHEYRTIIKHIRSISFFDKLSKKAQENVFDMFELESRTLNEYFSNIYK